MRPRLHAGTVLRRGYVLFVMAVPSGQYAFDQPVEDVDHLSPRPRAVRRFGDVQGGLVTGARLIMV